MNTKWVCIALLSAVVAIGVVAVAVHLKTAYGLGLLAVGVVTFLIVLVQNPEHWARQTFSSLLGAFIAINAVPSFSGYFRLDTERLGYLFMDGPSWPFNFPVALLLVGLLIYDFAQRNPSTWLLRAKNKDAKNLAGDHATVAQVGDIQATNVTINVSSGAANEAKASAILQQAALGGSGNVSASPNIHSEIDAIKQYLHDDRAEVAIELLSKLKTHHWHEADARAKFRILANLGHAYDALEDYAKAAAYFTDARKWQSDDPDARALEAMGLANTGDTDRAFDLAGQIISESTSCSLAAALIVRYSPQSKTLNDIEEHLPPASRESVEVLDAFAVRACECGRNDLAEGYVRRAMKQLPTSLQLKDRLATILLERAHASAKRSHDERVSELNDVNVVKEAIELLAEGIEKRTQQGRLKALARSRFNRGNAYRLLGDIESADTDFREACRLSPDDHQLIGRYGYFLSQIGKIDRAIEVIRTVAVGTKEVALAILFVDLLVTRGKEPDWHEALQILEARLKDVSSMSSRDLTSLADAISVTFCHEAAFEDGLRAIDTLATAGLESATCDAARARIHHKSGNPARASELLRSANESLPSTVDFEGKVLVSSVNKILGNVRESFGILKTIVVNDKLTPLTHPLISEARECDEIEFLLDFCSNLRMNGIFDTVCLDAELTTLEKFNAPQKAMDVIDDALVRCNDEDYRKVLRLRRSMIAWRRGDLEKIETNLDLLPDPEHATGNLHLAVVSVLGVSSPVTAAAYAYKVLRRRPHDSDAHAAMISVVGVGAEQRGRFRQPEIVGPDSAIQFKEEHTGEVRWAIIETERNPDPARDEFPPDHPFATRMLGKRNGEQFLFRDDEIQPHAATITAIVSKYVLVCQRCLDDWERNFPDKFFVKKFHIPQDADGQPVLDPILKQLDADAERKTTLLSIYRENPIPVVALAKAVGSSVLDAVAHIAGDQNLPFRCCRGTDDEVANAMNAIGDENVTIVADITALATLFVTELFRRIDRLPFRCAITEGTLEELRHQLMVESEFPSQGRMVKQNDRYFLYESTEDQIAARRQKLQDFVNWIQNAAVVTDGLRLASIATNARHQIEELFGRATAETMAAASSPGHVLWTDDFAVADVARQMFSAKRVWTHILLRRFHESGNVSHEVFTDLTLSLLKNGFQFIPLDPPTFIAGAQQSHWDPSAQPLMAVCNWFANRDVKFEGIVALFAFALREVWRNAPLDHQRSKMTVSLCESLLKRPDGADILRAFAQNMERIFGVDVINARRCREVIQDLLNRYKQDRIPRLG